MMEINIEGKKVKKLVLRIIKKRFKKWL